MLPIQNRFVEHIEINFKFLEKNDVVNERSNECNTPELFDYLKYTFSYYQLKVVLQRIKSVLVLDLKRSDDLPTPEFLEYLKYIFYNLAGKSLLDTVHAIHINLAIIRFAI